MVGFKYKMSNIQQAIGCAQIERIDELFAGKRRIFQGYREGLAGIKGIAMNSEPVGTKNGFWMPTVVFDKSSGITREMMQSALAREEIDARVFFSSTIELADVSASPGNDIAYSISMRAINLPSYHDMTSEELRHVCNAVANLAISERRLYDWGYLTE